MITRIDYIKKFGIFNNFSWSEHSLVDFKQKNLIYGWNYSGKTTLSRIFSSLRDKVVFDSYSKGDFKVTTSHGTYSNATIVDFNQDVLVFNSDYVQDNLRWEVDDEINAIFFEVGDQAIISQKVADLESRIVKIEGNEELKGEKAVFEAALADFVLFEEKLFTDESRRIKNEVLSSLIEFNKGHFKKQLDLVIQDLNSFILNKSEVTRLSKIVKVDKPKPPLSLLSFNSSIERITQNANTILNSVPDKKNIIKILDSNTDALKWVEKGLELNNEDEKCLFCDNVISKNRIAALNKYYQNEASQLRNKVEPLLERIENEKTQILAIDFPKSVNDINEGFQDRYINEKKKIEKVVKAYVKTLEKMKVQLHIKSTTKIYERQKPISDFNKIQLDKSVKNINMLLEENNKFSEDFNDLIKVERIKFINHLVAKYILTNNYRSKKRKHAKAVKEIEKLDRQVETFRKKIERLKAKKSSAEEGGQQFKYFVQSFLGKDDIDVKFDKTIKKYNLLRGNQIAKHLSEGEKMAISFSHFLVTLKASESKDKLKDTIVVIDDPISSLDGNHVFQINALLKDFLYKKLDDPNNPGQKFWKQKCKQLFISTHNYEFFNLLKEMPTTNGFRYSRKPEKGNESRYFISRKVNNSEIVALPQVYNNFKSEYHYLFKQIHDFALEVPSEKVLIMPNILRRFLEIYTLAKYPSSEEVDDRASEIWDSQISKRICKPFHFFSHFNNIDRIGQHSELLADVKSACNELMKQLKKDKTHYKALQATL